MTITKLYTESRMRRKVLYPITPFRSKGTFGHDIMTYCKNYRFQSDFSIELNLVIVNVCLDAGVFQSQTTKKVEGVVRNGEKEHNDASGTEREQSIKYGIIGVLPTCHAIVLYFNRGSPCYCNWALELTPDFITAYVNRGIAYTGLKEYNNALEVYQKALELDSDNFSIC